jgi:hypothetical protein
MQAFLVRSYFGRVAVLFRIELMTRTDARF